MPKLDEQEWREILRLKAEFRVKYPFDVAKRLSRLSAERNVWSMIGLKPDEFEQVMDFYLDKNLLQDEIAHIAIPGVQNVMDGPLLGSGCKRVYRKVVLYFT